MGSSSSSIHDLIAGLDHPDAELQDRLLARLDRRPEDAYPVVLEALSMDTPWSSERIRRALLRWLANHLDARATLALMRYIYDSQGDPVEDLGRGLALALLRRRARRSEDPSERGRLRAFAEDLLRSEDPEVQLVCAQLLGHVGTAASRGPLRKCPRRDRPRLQAAVQKSLQALQEAPPNPHVHDPLSVDRLTARLRQSAGPRRTQLIRRWKKHPRRHEIALALLEEPDLQSTALQCLIARPAPEAREPIAALMDHQSHAALAIRAFGRLAIEQPTSRDRTFLRRALESSDPLIQSAAADAVQRLQLYELVRPVIALSHDDFVPVAQSAAEALQAMAGSALGEHLLSLEHSLDRNLTKLSRRGDSDARMEILQALLEALEAAMAPSLVGLDRLQRRLVDELLRPDLPDALLTPLLSLLSQAVMGDQGPSRWPTALSERCLGWLNENDSNDRRVGAIANLVEPLTSPQQPLRFALVQAVAGRAPALASRYLHDWWREGPSPEVDQVLEAWSQHHSDGSLKEASRQLLQTRRMDRQQIDVTYIPRD